MSMINVNRDNPDPFYRYKMPSIIAKVEGKGNGIKTVIVNMVEIGKALGRPPSYPCKFFGCELGAQTQMDTKIGRYIVNGAHEGPKLQDILDNFIKKFVLCPGCENPETDLHIQASKARIGVSCKACGYHGMIESRHKVTTFIINHPPNSTEDASSKKGKKGRKGEKQKGGKKGQGAEAAPASPTEEQGEADFIPPPTENGDDDANWSVDTSEEAVLARKEDLTGLVSTLTLDDSEKSPAERVNIFFKFVEGLMKTGGSASVQASLAKVKTEAERLDVMDKAAGILGELLYTDQLLSQIKEYRTIMLPFVVDNKRAQKYLLIGFEKLVGEVHPPLLAKVPHILKAFYDEDILDEEAILDWADKASTKHVSESIAKKIHENAAPIVEWLRNAEEESSGEEEEDEDEVEVVYSEQAGSKGITTITEQAPQPAEQGGVDIDIDAI